MSQIFVVLRSSKERSLPLAIEALKDAPYTVIEEAPFSKALKKMFAIAQENPSKYLLALDADVILHSGALATIEKEADRYLQKFPHLFFLDFWVMDKFRGKACSGCHLYVNQYSPQLFSHSLDQIDETRPENQLVLDFAKKHQLIHEISPLIVGLHDYEQYYRDLYAKYYRRALRRSYEVPMLLEIIEARRRYFPQEDKDFDVVLRALQEGLKGKEIPPFDARSYRNIEDVMPLTEKTLN